MLTDTDMDSLPILVLEKIIQYLSNQDLAACCACSISWRETFDQDAWWEPRCDRTIASHLRITECEVEPGFVSPEREDSKLRQISEWRMSFMRETHLWRNWRQRRYVEQKIKVERWQHFCFLTGTDVLVKVIATAEVWDIRKTPRCLGEVFTLNGSDGKCHVFELFDDNKFLVLQDVTLHLYQMSSPLVEPWKLIYTFNLATVVDQLSGNLREAHVTESILVLFLHTGSIFSFDLNSKIISSESKMPRADVINNGHYIVDILQSERKSMEFGYSEHEGLDLETGFYIFIYSARHKSFLNFRKHVSYFNELLGYFRCILSDNYIATFIDGSFEVTDFNTGEVLVDIEVDYTCISYMKGIEGICENDKALADCPPISMIMDNDIDSSFRIALSRSLGIKTYTRKMFLQHVCKYLNKALADCPPISMIMDNDIDSSFRIALSRSLGIKTYTRKMFLQHVGKYLNTQGNVNVYLFDHMVWLGFTNPGEYKKCNQVYTCAIDKGESNIFKIW